MPQAAPEDRPLVSIVTSVYNRLAYAQPSLDSLLAQTWPNFEIVMVDDGSTDGTEDWLDSLTDPRIRVLRQENQGNGAGLNTAIAAARGELIAIHDFGDICHPDRVARQAEVLLSHTEIGVVSCWLSRRDVVSGDRTHLHHRKTLPFRDAILRSAPFSHGEVMYRKALWRAAGGYRREFRYAVDRDLFIRLSRLCEYHVIEEELYEQLLFPGGISSAPEKLILQAYFAELANECGHRVLRGEEDLVTRHSHAAAFFLKPSATVANRIARHGLAPLSTGDRATAERLLTAGRAEKATPFTVLAMLVYRMIYFSGASERALLPLFAKARRRWTQRSRTA